jgi:hypothetical protein
MSKYIRTLPPLTLFGGISSSTTKDLYGINDGSGLANVPRTFDIVVSGISTQTVGDDNIGTYTGFDVSVGDYISKTDGLITLKIISISSKSATGFTCVVEDVNMGIARTRTVSNPNELQAGASIVIFKVNNDNSIALSADTLSSLTINNAVDSIQSYLNLQQPFQTFSFTPVTTGSLQLGDLVTITGSGDGYELITSSLGDTTIGTVSELYTENVIVRPYNKIITSFDAPEKLTGGVVGSIWYESGSGQITTSSADNRNQKFLQLTNAIGTSVTGSVDGATFDETSYNLIINGIETIPQNPGGGILSISEITSSINSLTDQHHVTAGIEVEGGNAEVSSGDPAGIGGEDGTTKFNVGNNILIVVGSSATLPFNNPSAPGKFEIIVSSGYTLEIHPTTANQTISGLAYADEFQIANDINAEATAQGAPIQATATTGTLTIETIDGSNLEINKISPFTSPNTTDCVGLNSGTGLPTGVFNAPPSEYYLTLSRTDGGQVFMEGTWINAIPGQAEGLYNIIGQPPYILMLEGGSLSSGGGDDDWYVGSTFLTSSRDVLITGSLLVNRQDSLSDFFIITSGSYDTMKVDSEGITRFFSYTDEIEPWATADYGGLYYMSSSVWAALD